MAATVFHTYDNTLYEKVYQTAYQAAAELIETAGMKAGQDVYKRQVEGRAEHLADRLVPYTFLGTCLLYTS